MMAQPPVVRLAARQSGAVDAALLACAHTDGLAVFDVADGVGLGVLQGNQGDNHVDFSGVRQLLVLCDQIGQHLLVDLEEVVSLLKDDAEDMAALDGSGGVIGVDLHHVVVALFLGLENFERLVGVAGSNDAVGDLIFQILGGSGIADVG